MLGDGALDDLHRLGHLGEVGGDDRRRSARCPYGGGNVVEVGRGPGHEDDVRPGPGVSLGDPRPDPPACAGDQGNVPVEPELIGAFTRRRRRRPGSSLRLR